MDTYKKQGDNEKKRNIQNIVFDLHQLLERSQSFMTPLPPTSKSDEPMPTTPSTPKFALRHLWTNVPTLPMPPSLISRFIIEVPDAEVYLTRRNNQVPTDALKKSQKTEEIARNYDQMEALSSLWNILTAKINLELHPTTLAGNDSENIQEFINNFNRIAADNVRDWQKQVEVISHCLKKAA